MRRIGTASRCEQAFAEEPRTIPGAKDFHQLIAMSGEDAGRDFPLWPGRCRKFVEIGLRCKRRSNAVAAEDDNELQLGVRIGSL